MAKLGDICTISSSNAPMANDQSWLLNLDMVEQQTGEIISYNYVGNDDLNGSIIQFDTDNVLYSKLRPNLNKVVIPDRSGFATSEMLPLKPNTSILCREYLAAYLRSDSFVSWAVSKTAGAKMPRLGTKVLLNKEIPLPPLEEQHHIATILDKLTNLIAKRRAQLEKLDLLVKSRFVEMFGDPETNAKKWDVLPLSEICSIGSSKRIYQSELCVNGIPFLRVSDLINLIKDDVITAKLYITEEKYQEFENQGYIPSAGDILVTSRGTLGQCYIIKENDRFYFQDGMISWLFNYKNNITPIYISHLFSMPGFRKQIDCMQAGSTVSYLSIDMLKRLNVMVPDIEIQKEFCKIVYQVEQSKNSISCGLEKLVILKKSLMQKYFERGV